MYSAYDIADYIIQQYDSQGKTVSNLKLQKILYFIQAEFLVSIKKPCFTEQIEAWSFGPVVPEIFCKYRVYGCINIPVSKNKIRLTTKDTAMINDIINECDKYSASELTQITLHQLPWINAYEQGCKNIILNGDIQKYFTRNG